MTVAMFKEKTNSLKIETLSQSEEQDYLIHSRIEIQQILQTICKHNTRSALYFDARRNFFLTLVLGANDTGIWIDPASRATDNRRLLDSPEIIFVSSHNQSKVQFVAHNPWQVIYEDKEAIFLPLPQQLLRLQRRDDYRLAAWPRHPLHCILKPAKNQARIMSVMDISLGGLSLECQDKDIELRPGKIYSDCEIDLPEVGKLTATIQIKNSFEITNRNGKTRRRVGCVFLQPLKAMTMPLQRYVAQMQCRSASAGMHP
jgi:c-di-GMP-binding flagellar brake protein YcgR